MNRHKYTHAHQEVQLIGSKKKKMKKINTPE